MKRCLALLTALLLPLSAIAAANDATVDLGESKATAYSSVSSVAAGSEFLLGVHVELDPHWHTYTYDPGDSGIPSNIEWTLPEGFSVSETYWPAHETFNEAGLTTYGFSDEVVLTVRATAPQTLPEAMTIKAKAEYLVCKDICIPQTADFTFTLPKGDATASSQANLLKQWHAKSQLASDWGDVKKKPIIPVKASTHSGGAPDTAQHTTTRYSLFTILLFALLGGLILNLMPCVFPVLSLKALAVAKHTEDSPAQVRKEGRAYTLGVLVCFWVLAALLISLKAAGESIGWGFQFQSPGFVGIMAMLMFAIGLNLSGLFEMPVLLGGLSTKLGNEHNARGSFFTGLLAALVATPCTAPFMAPAIGFALSQPALSALLIFTFLGLGLALPFLLLSHYPRLLSKLPRPGAWMETLKKALAFPMYATAIWLLWVLGTQTGADGIIFTLAITMAIMFLAWAKGKCHFKSHFCTLANLCLFLALLAILVEALGFLQASTNAHSKPYITAEEHFSEAKLAELRAAGTPVFVDATASWCITCKVNFKLAIGTEKVQSAFKQRGVVYMVADWTNRDAAISKYLARYGHNGVPLYVYYAPGEEGKILPQILTSDLILETIVLSD